MMNETQETKYQRGAEENGRRVAYTATFYEGERGLDEK